MGPAAGGQPTAAAVTDGGDREQGARRRTISAPRTSEACESMNPLAGVIPASTIAAAAAAAKIRRAA